MKKENVVDLFVQRDQQAVDTTPPPSGISKELEQAIQHLIYRLRELGPIQRSN